MHFLINPKHNMHPSLSQLYPVGPICNALRDISLHGEKSPAYALISVNGDDDKEKSVWSRFMDLLSSLYSRVGDYLKTLSWETLVNAGPVPHMLEEIYALLHKSITLAGALFVNTFKKIFEKMKSIWDYLFTFISDNNDAKSAREETYNFELIFKTALSYFVTIGKRIVKGILYVITQLKHVIWYATQALTSYFVMSIECAYQADVGGFKNNVIHTVCTMSCGFTDIMSMSDKPTLVEERAKLLFVYFQRVVQKYTPDMQTLWSNSNFVSRFKNHWMYDDVIIPVYEWIASGFSWLLRTFRVVFSSFYGWFACIFQAMGSLLADIVYVHVENFVTKDDIGIRATNQTRDFSDRLTMLKNLTSKLDETTQKSARETIDTIETIQQRLIANEDSLSVHLSNANFNTVAGEWSERGLIMAQVHLSLPVDSEKVKKIIERQYGLARLDDAVYLAAGMNRLVADELVAAINEVVTKYDDAIREATDSIDTAVQELSESSFVVPRSVNAGNDDDDDEEDEEKLVKNIDYWKKQLAILKIDLDEALLDLERRRPVIEAQIDKQIREAEIVHQNEYRELLDNVERTSRLNDQLQLQQNTLRTTDLLVARQQVATTKLVTFYGDEELRDAMYLHATQKIRDLRQKIIRVESRIATRERKLLIKTIAIGAVMVTLMGGIGYYALPEIVGLIKAGIDVITREPPPQESQGFWSNLWQGTKAKKDTFWNWFTDTLSWKDLTPTAIVGQILVGSTAGLTFLYTTYKIGTRVSLWIMRLTFQSWRATAALLQGESVEYATRNLIATAEEREALEQGILKDAFSLAGVMKQHRADAITSKLNVLTGVAGVVNPAAGLAMRGITNVVEGAVNRPTAINYDNFFGNPNVDPQMAYGSVQAMEQRRQEIAVRQEQTAADMQRRKDYTAVVAEQARTEVLQHGKETRSALATIVEKQQEKKEYVAKEGQLVV